MLLLGMLLIGTGLLVLVYSQLSSTKLPAGIHRSRGLVLSVSHPGHQQVVNGHYFAGREVIAFSFQATGSSTFFPGQQVYIDYADDDPSQPLQLLSIQEVMGRKFMWIIIAVLLVMAGVVFIRLAA